MADTGNFDAQQDTMLDGGAYEIIRSRLKTRAEELRTRLEKLDRERKDIFGAIEPALLATERITTENNCIPRDMTPVRNDCFLFGYNVRMGLKSETRIPDVFGVFSYENRSFSPQPPAMLQSGRFEEDFKNLYKYYRETRFVKFSTIGPHLFMVFRIGKAKTDIKTFKWAVEGGGLTYIDNRSDHEFTFPPQQEFTWIRTTRDMHRTGVHPHISIDDRVFVEAVGGDVTFKVEDNTDAGQGIFAEPVNNPDQTLDDAEISYALLDHIILVRIRPYQEEKYRHYIFNEKLEEVVRVDALEHSCVLLPGDQGLIFPSGYYLMSGELKRFENLKTDMLFERRIASANGEDILFVFYDPDTGDYILMPYNRISQQVENPVTCNGFSIFDTGEMLYFRSEKEPRRHHVIQIWQTPYVGGDYAFTEKSDTFLYKVGNPQIVRFMAEAEELLRLVERETPYMGLYVDLVRMAQAMMDAYFWIDKKEAFSIKEVIQDIREAAGKAVEEFEKVTRIKKSTNATLSQVETRVRSTLDPLDPELLDSIDRFVELLSALRTLRGEIIGLRDLRYVELEKVDALEKEVVAATEDISARCVEFLLTDKALAPYEQKLHRIEKQVETLDRVVDANRTETQVNEASKELEMLIEIVSGLKIEDSTHTTKIIDNISDIYTRLNQVSAALKKKRKSLGAKEGEARFAAQIKLISQGIVNYMDLCDTPEKCDEYLSRVMIQIEDMEGQFSEFDAFLAKLSEKREEAYNAFESRKLSIIEKRNKRANALMQSAQRILTGISNRTGKMKEVSEIHTYFASDVLIEKVRGIVEELLDLGDTVKADDIRSRMKTIKEDAVRSLKDKKDLFADGENLIRFGSHVFTVNTRALNLTIVRKNGDQYFHLSGTDFFEKVNHPDFEETRPVWDMEVVSETPSVYRGEYLAFQMLLAAEKNGWEFQEEENEEVWITRAKDFMASRFQEGYGRGIHDRDAGRIARELFRIRKSAGLLRYSPSCRAMARIFWEIHFLKEERQSRKAILFERLKSFGEMHSIFAGKNRNDKLITDIRKEMQVFMEESGLFPENLPGPASRYLFHELTTPSAYDAVHFILSKDAHALGTGFLESIRRSRLSAKFGEARESLSVCPDQEFEMIRDWVRGYLVQQDAEKGSGQEPGISRMDFLDEVAACIFMNETRAEAHRNFADCEMRATIEGMLGDHPVLAQGRYTLSYLHFTEKMQEHQTRVVPVYTRYQELKTRLMETLQKDMRLEEFKPRVLSSFVRNMLIDRVYLPLIGDNLAKQMGTAGEDKRTDLMGLLLLISPPGYGKTTLMEYIANRLGVIFMKINGPAIGHGVTGLDPAEAKGAAARQELEKLNLSFEMGDNVMIYLDDIQHLTPEFLQKFISLCDAQRKVEGVYKGRSRTYDFRGKKVAVVMAGNPYTESGEKFRIPDMLANRADVYNLGDIIGGNQDYFNLSFLENALTSNPVLNPLSAKSRKDIHGIIRIAETGDRESVELESPFSADELSEMVEVMKKLIYVRDIILKVNAAYIHSAGQEDAYRTEPPFRLQGSYRNMNRLAEKIVPLMNQEELITLVVSDYENEAQTLTTGAEANILKFKELTGLITEEETARWAQIKKTFRKNLMFLGMDEKDPVSRVVAQLSGFQEGLASISETLRLGKEDMQNRETGYMRVGFDDETMEQLYALFSELNLQVRAENIGIVPSEAGTSSGNTTSEGKNLGEMAGNYFYRVLKDGDIRAVEMLLQKGQNPNITTPDGATPLMAAALHNQPEIVQILLENGAEVDKQDKNGYNPLMIAASRGHNGIIRLLLEHGADPNLKDKNGWRPLDWAEKNGHREASALLSQ